MLNMLIRKVEPSKVATIVPWLSFRQEVISSGRMRTCTVGTILSELRLSDYLRCGALVVKVFLRGGWSSARLGTLFIIKVTALNDNVIDE